MKLAAALKKKGNDYYQKESFELAAEYYTRAINVSPTEEPVYYSNRGACECTNNSASDGVLTTIGGYMNMKPPKFELIIEDCDKAISLNKDYVKAINRRANALEALDRLEEALRGRLTPLFALSRLTFFRKLRLHRCHDPGRIPEREGCPGGGTSVKETLFDESRRNHQGSHPPFLPPNSH